MNTDPFASIFQHLLLVVISHHHECHDSRGTFSPALLFRNVSIFLFDDFLVLWGLSFGYFGSGGCKCVSKNIKGSSYRQSGFSRKASRGVSVFEKKDSASERVQLLVPFLPVGMAFPPQIFYPIRCSFVGDFLCTVTYKMNNRHVVIEKQRASCG